MGAFVTSEKFKNLDFPTADAGTDYLMGCIGDKMQCIIEFYTLVSAENITIITSETTSNNTLRRTDSGSFLKDGFRIGNSISTTGMGADSGNFSVTDVSDKLITIAETLTTKTTHFPAFIYRTNLVTAGDYYYNLIENEAPDSFVSLVDSETQQRYTVSGITATGTTGTFIIASNSKGWAVDADGFGVIIDGLGVSNYRQYFRITQTFIITPVVLYSQLENLQNGIPPAPDYWADRKCLRHLAKIDMKIERTDPEIVDTVTFSRKGNTAWLGEFLNGEPATYTASAPVYTHGSETVTEIQYDSSVATLATITLTSANTTFTTGTTATLQIAYIPADDSDFTNTVKTYRECFAFDRATLTCGAAPVGGINLGTNASQIFSAYATFVNAATITMHVTFRMAAALATKMSGKSSDNRNYLLFATVQDPTITATKGTDRNAVKIEVNSYSKNLDDSTLFGIFPNVNYYNASGGLLGSQVNGVAGDIVRAVAPFRVKNSGSQKLYSIGVRTDAVYTGATGTFTLEQWTSDTSSVCLDDGVQEISIQYNKNYRLPANHILNKITVTRNEALDTVQKAGYTLSYPFQLRYETWRTLDNADCDFGNATQNWAAISAKPGWSIKQYITATVYDPTTDHETDFTQECIINVSSTGATGSTGSWGVVTTYDDAGTTPQFGDILNYENTTVVADHYGDFSSLPTGVTGYYGMLFLDQQTLGGANWVYPFSSAEDLRQEDGGSPWMGPTGTTGVCTITLVSSTHIQIRAKLDYTKLSPAINNYNLRSKLDYLT